MTWQTTAAAAIFVAAFLLLALGRLGRIPLKRGTVALVAGGITALLLRVSWRVIDLDILALLAGLMMLAGLAEATGLLAPVARLAMMAPHRALRVAIVVMMVTSAVLLNDAAVVVLLPMLMPVLMRHGLAGPHVVVLLAIAANIGSLLTPFGNPQNAVLAAAGGLTLFDFLLSQGPWAVLGGALLWWMAKGVHVGPPQERTSPPMAGLPGQAVVLAAVAAFVASAAAAPWTGWSLGWSAFVVAVVATLALAVKGPAVRVATRAVDRNVMLLFVGLFLLTGGLGAWFPAERVSVASLDDAGSATLTTLAMSNLLGNVPAMLTYQALDPAWTAQHAAFLVAVSTIGGSLLVTGSAASLLAADIGRLFGAEVRFWPYARRAIFLAPLLVLAAYVMW